MTKIKQEKRPAKGFLRSKETKWKASHCYRIWNSSLKGTYIIAKHGKIKI